MGQCSEMARGRLLLRLLGLPLLFQRLLSRLLFHALLRVLVLGRHVLTSFWVRVSLSAADVQALRSDIASCASRLCRTHRRASIFVDFNHIASGVSAAREAFETFWALRDDRVGIGARLDHVALFDLLVKERVETIPARA